MKFKDLESGAFFTFPERRDGVLFQKLDRAVERGHPFFEPLAAVYLTGKYPGMLCVARDENEVIEQELEFVSEP